MDSKTELELMNSEVRDLNGLNLHENLTVLNLHHNCISEISGLTKVSKLRFLDLSSNSITRICGMNNLQHLRTLNLSSNKIRIIESLDNLHCLVRLDVSFNEIISLDGLKKLFGPSYSLTVIILQGNKIESKQHVLDCTKNLVNLRQLTLFNPQTGDANPVCRVQGYRMDILQGLPQLEVLDHVDRMGRATQIDVLADLPELNDFMDLLSTASLSESNHLEVNKFQGNECYQTQTDFPDKDHDSPKKNVDGVKKVLPCKQDKDYIPPSSSSIAEHRLLSLESQLNSLVTLQLMKMYQAESDHSICHCNTHQTSLATSKQDKSNNLNVHCEARANRPHNRIDRSSSQHIPEKEVPDETLHIESDIQSSNMTSKLVNEHQTSHSDPCVASTNSVGQSSAKIRYTSDSNHSQHPAKPVAKIEGATVDNHPPGAPAKPTLNLVKTLRKNTSDKKNKQETLKKLNCSASKNQIIENCGSEEQEQCPPVSSTSNPTLRTQSNDYGKGDKTIGKILKELDQEKTLRKQAEQLCQDLVGRIRELEASVIDENEALKVTEDLKQAFTVEHQEKLSTQSQLKEMENKFNEICQVADNLRIKEETEKSRYQQEIENLNQLLNEARKDYKNVLSRAENSEQKLDKAQSLLHNREIEYRRELDSRYKLDSPELTKLISTKIDLIQTRNQHTIDTLQEKLTESIKRYTALEDEFRMALRIEAERYDILLKTSELCKEELGETQSQLKEKTEREESIRHLIEEMNTVIKEQKSKYTSQQKANLLLQHNLKERIATLEAHLEEARTRITNHENLRKELKQQKAEMLAQESIIAGLRAERRNWSEELAKQGSALAQDRGRLEAKIEAQELEIASLKKSLKNESDSVKIKNKIVDDQTETILNLKKCIQENQAEIKRLQNEAVQNHRSLENQLNQKVKENTEMNEEIKHLVKRKEDLKQLVSELQLKVDELQEQNDSMSKRWRDRASLIDKLEKQVERMHHNWEEEQKRLTDERDAAQKQVRTLHSQMESMDEGFRQQLVAVEEMKEYAINNARNEAEKLRLACETRVVEVESEMRTILLEAENSRQAMEERLKSISIALCNPVLPEFNTLPSQHLNRGEYFKDYRIPSSSLSPHNTAPVETSLIKNRINPNA